jgi:outer membrane receptor protein involved in Fe transport
VVAVELKRWFANINHTIQLDSTVLVAPGGPTLDLLDGDALGSSGTSRHSTEFSGGLFYNGFGTRMSANYKGPTRIDGSGLPGSTDLFFGDLLTFDLRMFADLGRQEKLVGKMPFLKNVRVSLGVDNLFNARQRVTDSNGDVPLSYQPFLLDPVGRFIEFEIRKVF